FKRPTCPAVASSCRWQRITWRRSEGKGTRGSGFGTRGGSDRCPLIPIPESRIPPRMHSAISQFLRFLSVERNAAALTAKSYREDLTSLADYLTQAYGRTPTPGEITPLDLRGYISALHEAGYAKTSVARRLASLRTFYKFAPREGLAASNPPH